MTPTDLSDLKRKAQAWQGRADDAGGLARDVLPLIAEVERLRGRQRMEGTVEVCAHCKCDPMILSARYCDLQKCPIRAAQLGETG